jgi:hypothetical protein
MNNYGMGGICTTYSEKRSAYKMLMGKPEGRRPLEKPKLRRRIVLMWNLKKEQNARV